MTKTIEELQLIIKELEEDIVFYRENLAANSLMTKEHAMGSLCATRKIINRLKQLSEAEGV